jgi:carbonic anhydrase
MLNMERRILTAMLALSMMAIAACKQQGKIANDTHKSPLENIMDGNARFASVHSIHPDESAKRTREISEAQHPMAVVIACSDSRVSPELVFDEGLGDLFVIRTAGNIIGEAEFGSVEYAVEHLEVPLIIVMGHERCGAVKAMVEGVHPGGHLQSIMDSLSNEEEIKAIPLSDKHRLEHCVMANIQHGVHSLLTQSAIIREKVANKTLKVVGAHYDLDDRKVTLLQ